MKVKEDADNVNWFAKLLKLAPIPPDAHIFILRSLHTMALNRFEIHRALLLEGLMGDQDSVASLTDLTVIQECRISRLCR